MAECALFGTYGFSAVAFTINQGLVTGFDEGDDVINVEPGSDLGTSKMGADGTGILSISADQSATITMRLLPVSPWNAWLRNRVQRQRLNPSSPSLPFPVGMTDLSSREAAGCTNALVIGESNWTRGTNVNALEWKIWCPCWQPSTLGVIQP